MNTQAPKATAGKNKKNKLMTAAIAASILVVLGVMSYWHFRALHPTTNDAYLQAHVIYIAPQVTGAVTAVHVKEHARVKQGDLLFEIDATPYQNAMVQAQAKLETIRSHLRGDEDDIQAGVSQVKQREAQLAQAKSHARRISQLLEKKILPAAKRDEVMNQLKVAKAALSAAKNQLHGAREKLGHAGVNNPRYQAAQAALKQAIFQLGQTKVQAPASGYLVNFKLRQGAVVNANQPLFSLIEAGNWWVNANFKETDIARIRPNQPVNITLDMYPKQIFKGVVKSISTGSGAAFSLLPPENASGNWVKVTQRFPVRIKVLSTDKHYPLRLGASAKVTIDTTVNPH